LNFGNPEKPEIMWELKRSIEGITSAARALGTPVVSGNVSLYNETNGVPIFPTPTIGMVGLLNDWENAIGAHFRGGNQDVLLIGTDRSELGGSMWLAKMRGIEAGRPPEVDLGYERRLHQFLAATAEQRLANSAHDVSEGGIAVALAESCFGLEGCGASVTLNVEGALEGCLFSESTGRVLMTTDRSEELLKLASSFDVPASVIGFTGGEKLKISSSIGSILIETPVARLKNVWKDAIGSLMDPEE
jgi:phosphoribosylformylglycinamidine synthase